MEEQDADEDGNSEQRDRRRADRVEPARTTRLR
jgi:hypothetical protein